MTLIAILSGVLSCLLFLWTTQPYKPAASPQAKPAPLPVAKVVRR